MNKKKFISNLALACGIIIASASCDNETPNSDNNNTNNTEGTSRYVIAASVTASGNTTYKGDRMKCWNGVTAVNGITH